MRYVPDDDDKMVNGSQPLAAELTVWAIAFAIIVCSAAITYKVVQWAFK